MFECVPGGRKPSMPEKNNRKLVQAVNKNSSKTTSKSSGRVKEGVNNSPEVTGKLLSDLVSQHASETQNGEKLKQLPQRKRSKEFYWLL
jgi:hypothetical protein